MPRSELSCFNFNQLYQSKEQAMQEKVQSYCAVKELQTSRTKNGDASRHHDLTVTYTWEKQVPDTNLDDDIHDDDDYIERDNVRLSVNVDITTTTPDAAKYILERIDEARAAVVQELKHKGLL